MQRLGDGAKKDKSSEGQNREECRDEEGERRMQWLKEKGGK